MRMEGAAAVETWPPSQAMCWSGRTRIRSAPKASRVADPLSLATVSGTFLLCTGGNWTPNPPTYTLSYQWYSPAGTLVAGATTSSWTFAGHEGDTAYCAVRASNSAGQSAPTNTNTVTIPAALADEEPAARTATAHRPKRKKR